MLKLGHPRRFLAGLSLPLVLVPVILGASPSAPAAIKREISDAQAGVSFPLANAVTASLGSEARSLRAGSLGNIYARADDDEERAALHRYEYPQYALGYGSYEPYTVDVRPPAALGLEEADDDVVWGSHYTGGGGGWLPGNLDQGFRGPLLAGAAGYPYGAGALPGQPTPASAYNYARLAGYYYY